MSEIPGHFRERIEAAQNRQFKILNLSNDPYTTPSEQKLTSIPAEVFEMEHLESLDLSGNEIVEVPAHFYLLAVLRRFVGDRQAHIQCQKSYEMVDVLGLVEDVVGREQLLSMEARIRGVAVEEPRPQVLIHGSVDQVVVQQASAGENVSVTESRRGGIMGDQYNVHGQAGAVGANAHAHDMTFNQVWNQLESKMDLPKLADDLGRLREAMEREAVEPGHRLAAGAVAAAEQSAREKDGPKVMEYLKTAGKWAWGVAEKIGADLAQEALKGALGL